MSFIRTNGAFVYRHFLAEYDRADVRISSSFPFSSALANVKSLYTCSELTLRLTWTSDRMPSVTAHLAMSALEMTPVWHYTHAS